MDWATYQERITVRGGTRRQSYLNNGERFIYRKIYESPSFFDVNIFPQAYAYNIDSEESLSHVYSQSVAIIDSDNLDTKTICSMPEADIELGALVAWMDNYWIVTERDANTTAYVRATMRQCNYLLKWLTSDAELVTQWCIIEDGTKYMVGEETDRNFATTRGDSRIALTIGKNSRTEAFNRENRFLIDDDDSPHKLSYMLTKPMKLGSIYNGHGVYVFVLQEVTATQDDNHELGIADYYKFFERETVDDSSADDDSEDTSTNDVYPALVDTARVDLSVVDGSGTAGSSDDENESDDETEERTTWL